MRNIAFLGLLLPLLSACHDQSAASTPAVSSASSGTPQGKLALSSNAFGPGSAMPAKYSCEGDDVSPPLSWSGAPPGTRSLALIVQDPDAPDAAAPTKTVTHWVVYDLPAMATGIAEGGADLQVATHQAKNEQGDTKYMGPCPPKGRHRYFFKLYALDVLLPALDNAQEKDVEQALQGHVLGTGELIGTYQKSAG